MSITEHLASLLQRGQNTDVVLVACDETGGRKEIPAHSIILSRSPALERMFAADFREKETRKADIKVCSARVLEELVRFLYTDAMELPAPEGREPWPLEELAELAQLLHMYEVPKAATNFVVAGLAHELCRGRAGKALQLIELGARWPCVHQLLGREQIPDAFAKSLKSANFDELVEATKRAAAADLPPDSIEMIALCLASSLKFGNGKLLQVLAMALEARARAGPEYELCWANFQAACLAKVNGIPGLLHRELQAVASGDISLHLRSSRLLVLAKLAKVRSRGLKFCGYSIECLRCSYKAMDLQEDDCWQCLACNTYVSVTTSPGSGARARAVTCKTNHDGCQCFEMSCYKLFMCPRPICRSYVNVIEAPELAELESILLQDLQALAQAGAEMAVKLEEPAKVQDLQSALSRAQEELAVMKQEKGLAQRSEGMSDTNRRSSAASRPRCLPQGRQRAASL